MELRRSIANQTDASFVLTKHVISAHAKHSNLVFSPLSIHILLGMLAAGSGGPTRDQILGFLLSDCSEAVNEFFSQIVSMGLADGSPVGGPVLACANGLWVDQRLNLKPAYRFLLHSAYRAVSENVDFENKPNETRQEVNVWACNRTNGLIQEILPPDAVDRYTKLILANAVYFKGAWAEKFEASLTEERDFYLLNGSSVRAPLMSSRRAQYVRAFDGFKVLKLPYEQGKDTRSFSMCIDLPDARDGLPALTQRVCSQSGFINSHLPCNREILDEFRVPKFKIGFDFEGSGLLKSLGLVLPFAMGGLTEMVDCSDTSRSLQVSKIFHKSFVEVNEEGTEAAAVSAACVTFGSSRFPVEEKPRLKFVADHPFLFVIREDSSGLLLFIGQLLNPLAT
ncbi:Serine protease inhibitor family protein [Perilla frutescens var. hirtella]|nr:Serine protease inhibitor family protein [Perilla frutescens var. hirtella]